MVAPAATEVLERLARERFEARTSLEEEVAGVRAHLQFRESQVAALLQSTSWRITAPIRRTKTLARHCRGILSRIRLLGCTALSSLRERGVSDTWRRTRAWLKRARASAPQNNAHAAAVSQSPLYCRTTSTRASTLLYKRVLLVAELSLPQCKRYRVLQKRDHFRLLGVPCTVLDWRQEAEARAALQTHSLVIFYRAPGYASVLGLIGEARRLGVPTIWEVDDLIFDREKYETNGNLSLLDPGLRESVLDGVPLYRAALQACEYGLASTEILAEAMREAGTRRAFVVHNALDRETIACAERLLQRRLRRELGDAVVIFYGSGSKSHDGDFLCASRALAKLMRQRCNVRLRVVGDLTLSREFDALEDRIERLPFTDYPTYLRLMSETDITIAPLSTGLFNDGKSNIKFLESAVLAIPSVCSPRAEFRRAIADGETGYLADSEEDWLSALLQLADNAELRRTVGAAARKAALSGFEHSVIAHAEVAPLLAHFGEPPSRKLRVLEVNIYFAPRRFGGATIVAEEVSRQLHDRDDTDVFVFTSCDLPQLRPYEITRYEADGIPVLAVRLPSFDSRDLEFDNAHMQKVFAEVLLTVRPNVVHFHAIQGLTVSMADACVAAGTPYVITLHDAWWLCERQFMVRGDGRYCFQRKVDWKVCASCVPDLGFSLGRSNRLRTVLERSALLLAPSEHQRQLYAANELDCDHIVVNKNGIRPPGRSAVRSLSEKIRFAFVGGLGPLKGSTYIRRAFEEIEETNYELILVDNTLNMGLSSVHVGDWRLRGEVSVVPAYNQETIDSFFAGIDVLLFPTQAKESFGLTVREALIRDVWVVLTDSGGSVEDIVDGQNGTIIPIGDYVALRDAIRRILREPAQLAGYRNPYRDRIVTFQQQATEVRKLLDQAIAGHTVKEPPEHPACRTKSTIAA